MHDFWNVYEGLSQAHETQNFVKNLAIMAGLLVLSSNDGALAKSVDQQLAQNRD
jgi:putative oxidoreductase